MTEFIADNNACGQCILNLVSRGNAIIAEILRLKNYVPPIFRLSNKQDQQKYKDLISDFSYFKVSEELEKKIENDAMLQDLDEELRENHADILNRFYLAFESVHKFIVEVNQFVEDLNDGVYLQNSLESIFLNHEGCQLMCEALYLFGVMLLEVDRHIDGLIRERLLVSHYRYSAQQSSASSNIDDICKLFRSTTINSKLPPNYPEDYFKRTPINENLVSMVIGRLRSDDIYNQISAYPFPEHRVVALASQASMLFVCLFFDASILYNQTAKMREIVDKYFPDNWVVSVYLGFTINLIDAWDHFKAAKNALSNSLEISNIRHQTSHHGGKLQKLLERTKQMLREKALTEESVLGNTTKIMNVVRECNVTLRWLILHTTPPSSDCCKKTKQIHDQILGDMKNVSDSTLALLLNAAELEFKLKELFKMMLAEKCKRWEQHQKNSAEHLIDLSQVFSGVKPLMRVEKNENLHVWFQDMAKEIESLKIDEISVSSRKMVQIVQALDEVKEFHQLSSNMQVCQNLKEAKESLTAMIRSEGMKESLLITLQMVCDFSYAWQLVDAFTPHMQTQIKASPSIVVKLKAIFSKLSTALESVVLRINQAESSDLISVSRYYSQELVSYMRRVLQIIPRTMFSLMTRIIELQTNMIKELPTRLEKEKLRECAKLDDRFEVANLTHSIAVFSEGILSMQSTSLGVVQIDPQQLLEQGIRKELVYNIAQALHSGINFSAKSKAEELIKKLETLGDVMDGYRRSFEYIQDYIGIYGLKIWQEELSRVISYNVEQESNSFVRNKIPEWQSVHQSKAVPIPSFPPTDSVSVTFIGRLARQLIVITDPKVTVYMENSTAWYDHKTQREVINIKFFSQITKSVGTSGVAGLDKLISFMIVTTLQNFLNDLQKGLLKDKPTLDLLISISKGLSPNSKIIESGSRYYMLYISRAQKVWPQILDWVLKVGQLQLLRKHISYELRISCKFESKHLSSALETLNEALLNDVKAHYREPQVDPHQHEESSLLYELSSYLDWAGIGNPFAKIYVTTKNIPYFSLLMFLFFISQVSKFVYAKNIGTLMLKKTGEPLDGVPLIIGLATIFKQFHPEVRSQFLLYCSQYVKSVLDSTLVTSSKPEIPAEISSLLYSLEIFISYSGLPRSILSEHIPEIILNFHHSIQN